MQPVASVPVWSDIEGNKWSHRRVYKCPRRQWMTVIGIVLAMLLMVFTPLCDQSYTCLVGV